MASDEHARGRAVESVGYDMTIEPPLYRVVHHPASEPVAAAVVLAPFAEEKKAAQRALVELARALADAGWLVVRPDFRGTGDSGGAFGEFDLATRLDDVRQAVRTARAAAGDVPLSLIGLRLGATLAWLAAGGHAALDFEGDLDIDQVVLWEPILSGADFMRQNRQRSTIRRELTERESDAAAQGAPAAGEAAPSETLGYPAFDFDGFAISSDLHEQLAGVDLRETPAVARRALVLQVSGSSRIRKPLQTFADHAQQAGCEVAVDTVAVEPFWSAVGLVDTAPVRERTLAWLGVEATPAIGAIEAAQGEPAPVTDAVQARPLVLERDGTRVVGVLYQAPSPRERAIVLLHGWSGYRVGPGRLLTEAARELAHAGFPTYSFDFRGRGESGGEVGQASLNTMIADATAAVREVAAETGAERIALLGLCSGAEVAIGASLSDPRIDRLALWSAPVFSGDFTLARRARRSRKVIREYAEKLARPETWKKLAGGRLNWRMILRAVSGGRSNEDAGVEEKAPDTATQMALFREFDGKLLYLYGANDPETEPSMAFYREVVSSGGLDAEFALIEGANHNFYSAAWKREVIEKTLKWLDGD